MSVEDPHCWYCGGEAVLWCDYMIGREYVPEQIPLRIDETDWCSTLSGPKMTSAQVGRLEMDMRTMQPIATCDAAACASCAERHGWRRVGHVCGEGGCDTLDNCHVHARGLGPTYKPIPSPMAGQRIFWPTEGPGLGTSLYVPRGFAEESRREVRTLCRRAAMGVAP